MSHFRFIAFYVKEKHPFWYFHRYEISEWSYAERGKYNRRTKVIIARL